jgi:two-component system, OmpR family, sensor kinase
MVGTRIRKRLVPGMYKRLRLNSWRPLLAGSLSQRLALWNVLALLAALLVMSGVVYWLVTQRLLTELHAQAGASAAEIRLGALVIERVGTVLLVGLIFGSVLAALLAYAGSIWLTQRELRPLQKLTYTMQTLDFRPKYTEQPRAEIAAATEIRQLQKSFEAMLARLETSAQREQAFVAEVSHELRTPLTTLRGQIEVMLLNPDLDRQIRQDIEGLNIELQRLSRLVANLLTDVRAEAQQPNPLYVVRQQSVELDLLLVEAARQAQFLNQNVRLNITQLEQLQLAGDPDLLKQLLLNLLDNAMTYTPTGQQICLQLQTASACPGWAKDSEWAVFQITDSGPGIAPDDLPHIFERHYRTHKKCAFQASGNGLGLYIASLIAQAHDGKILVENLPTRGSCFSIWLPLGK